MFTAAALALALGADTPALPAEWHGTWAGTMLMTSAADKRTEVPVVMEIGPAKGGKGFTWKTTYGDGDKKVVKDYLLVPDGDKPGRFVCDERNGIGLAARLVDGVMYSTFEVGGAVLTARYELREKVLRFEITSAKPAKEKTGGGQVQDYPVDVVQAAELKRSK
jgi:hypothetical protein